MTTLRTLRRLFAAHAGGSPRIGVATSGSSLGYLEDPLLMSSIDQGDQYKESYLFRPDAVAARDQLRQVARVDLDRGWIYPDWPEGQEYTNSPWDGSAGEVYELLSPWFHPTQEVHSFLNEALKFCQVPGELWVPLFTSAPRQDLATYYPWLTDLSQVFQVGYLAQGESRSLVDPYGGWRGTWGPRRLYGRLESDQDGAHIWIRGWSGSATPTRVTTVSTVSHIDDLFGLISLVASINLPTTYPYHILIDAELFTVTGLASGSPPAPGEINLVTTRGDLNTTIVTHDPSTPVYLSPASLYLRGLFPAYGLCRPAGGSFGDQSGLTLDTDETIPDAQWVVAGALKEAWTSAPHIMEQIAESHRVSNLQQATLAFQRWQEQTFRRANLRHTFRDLEVAYF